MHLSPLSYEQHCTQSATFRSGYYRFTPAVHQHSYDNYQIEIIHLNGGSLTFLSLPLRRKSDVSNLHQQ
jgi:hypothetical protein